jgi:lactoylglutathione lyase
MSPKTYLMEAITLFSADLPASRIFYSEALEFPCIFEDDTCTVFDIGGLMLNVLAIEAAPELVEPCPAVTPRGSSTLLMTLQVTDCRAAVTRLKAKGVPFLNGPVDRPWGRRTAAFVDPSGHSWELAEVLSDG